MMACNGIFRWQRPFPLKKRLFSALWSLLVVLIILQFIACKDYETPDSYNVLPAEGDQVSSFTVVRVNHGFCSSADCSHCKESCHDKDAEPSANT